MALRTNCKEVKEAVRKYLTENVMLEIEENEIETEKPFTWYFENIKEEKRHIKYRSNFEMFEDWLRGLGGFGDDIYYHSSKKGFYGGRCQDILQDWLKQTDEEVKKYDARESEDLMLRLCWREFIFLLNKENGFSVLY